MNTKELAESMMTPEWAKKKPKEPNAPKVKSTPEPSIKTEIKLLQAQGLLMAKLQKKIVRICPKAKKGKVGNTDIVDELYVQKRNIVSVSKHPISDLTDFTHMIKLYIEGIGLATFFYDEEIKCDVDLDALID